jgi:hypothetical protein
MRILMIGALSLERNRKPCGAMGRRHRLMNRLGRALGCAAILFSSSLCQAEIVRQEVSRPRPNEVDTADRGGQIGGSKLGRSYRLIDLRCAAGEAIVGLRTRRGSVLDYIQIECARPVCDSAGCQWRTSFPGRAAGGSDGGNAQPPMSCKRNEMLSGIRGRTVTFTVFDYAADLEIECAPMSAPPTAEGFIAAASRTGASGGPGSGGLPSDGSRGLARTGFISCVSDYGFGVTAVSWGNRFREPRPASRPGGFSVFPKAVRLTGPPTLKMVEAMDRCFRKKAVSSITHHPTCALFGQCGSSNSTVFTTRLPDRQPPYLRAYRLAEAFATYLLDLQQQKFPAQTESCDYRTRARWTIIGFLAHCLRSKENLLQKKAEIRVIGLPSTGVSGLAVNGNRISTWAESLCLPDCRARSLWSDATRQPRPITRASLWRICRGAMSAFIGLLEPGEHDLKACGWRVPQPAAPSSGCAPLSRS